ncbi:ABC-type Fe3+-siderophore transport system permease subunit [Kroppenstedtia sanguinis]
MATALFIYFFSWRNGVLDPQRLILVGIAAGSGLGALSLYLSLKLNPQDFEMATVWLLGSIWNTDWKSIASMLPWLLLFVPAILYRSRVIDLFRLGDEAAKGLGVSTETEKKVLFLLSIGIISACVSVSGNIGFVGLIAPHIAKGLVGPRHRYVLPVSGAFGMLLVTISDWIAKVVFSPVELPVGVILSIIGVPYFIYLLFSARRKLGS